MYIMAPEPILMVYFINHFHKSVCLYVYPTIVARQRLCRHVPAQRLQATVGELLDASFSVRSVPYQKKVDY
jgi:hypothetical protein